MTRRGSAGDGRKARRKFPAAATASSARSVHGSGPSSACRTIHARERSRRQRAARGQRRHVAGARRRVVDAVRAQHVGQGDDPAADGEPAQDPGLRERRDEVPGRQVPHEPAQVGHRRAPVHPVDEVLRVGVPGAEQVPPRLAPVDAVVEIEEPQRRQRARSLQAEQVQRGRAEQHVRMRRHVGDHRAEVRGSEQVVVGEPREELAAGALGGQREVVPEAGVLGVAPPADARIGLGVPATDVGRGIDRCVVGDQDLQVRVLLGERRVERLGQEVLAVADGDADGDERRVARHAGGAGRGPRGGSPARVMRCMSRRWPW
jgi:hypothetical protein